MLIDSLLEPNEICISSWGILYATEKRIVRLESAKIGYQLNDLSYNKVDRVSTSTARRKSMIVLGVLVALMGFILFPKGTMETVFILTGLSSVIGAILGIGRSRSLQIYNRNFDYPTQTLWGFHDYDTPEMRRFCSTLGSMVSQSGGKIYADQAILRKIKVWDIP